MPLPPWKAPVGVEAVVRGWTASGSVRPCLTADREIGASEGSYADLPADLCPELARALRSRGIGRLYSHQAAAIAAARSGRHVVIATPTASGKSLCFHLPVLDALAREPDAS